MPPRHGYAAAWTRDDDLEGLNRRLHETTPPEELLRRAGEWIDRLYGAYPDAVPRAGSSVLEFGSGVGWIMEGMLGRFPDLGQIVGLDISRTIASSGRARLSHPKSEFVVYDGRRFPFRTGAFDSIYSCAAIQHIEKHAAFLLMLELNRVLAPRGHAVLHVMTVDHIPHAVFPYEVECRNHVDDVPEHWHHYYSFDELFVLFAEVMGVDDLDITPTDDFDSFVIHFSKGTGRPFRNADLPGRRYRARLGEPPRRGVRRLLQRG
jgi:SAM-dependent methyltransferase